jgi:hypothetical protein
MFIATGREAVAARCYIVGRMLNIFNRRGR